MTASSIRTLKALFAGMFIAMAFSLNAQEITLTQVVEAFNAGAEKVNSGEFEAAIDHFNKSIDLAEQLGEEGEEMKARAESQIPPLHYRIGLDLYKAKDIQGAVKKFEDAIEASEKYGHEEIRAKAEKIIPQLYNALGNAYFKQQDYQKAVENFNMATRHDPGYARAYFGKGLACKQLGNNDAMLQSMKKAIETGRESGDDRTAERARNTAGDYLLFQGEVSKKAEEHDEAISLLQQSLEYKPGNPDAYLQMAKIYNKQLEYNQALEMAQEGLDSGPGDEIKEAALYFEKGKAYTGLVEYEKACDAYKKSARGPFQDAAFYKINNVLKCE